MTDTPTPQASQEPELDATTAAKSVPEAAAVAAETVRSKVSPPPPPVLIVVGAVATLGLLFFLWRRIFGSD